MRGPLDLSRELLAEDVLHEIVRLRRHIGDALELPDALDLPPTACLTARLYEAEDELLLTLVPAGGVPATTALARAAGVRRVRPVEAGRVSELTEYHPALVPPLGLPVAVRTVADAALADTEVVYTPTGDGSTALKIRAADLLALTGAVVAALVEPGAELDLRAETEWRPEPVGGGPVPLPEVTRR